MKYDVFILFARADADFARQIAKGFERINLSVLYKKSLPRPIDVNHRPLQDAIVEGMRSTTDLQSIFSLFSMTLLPAWSLLEICFMCLSE